MKLCDRCQVPGCCLNYLGEACASARDEYCPEVQPNNAEIVANMSVEEMADFLTDISMGLIIDNGIMNVKTWLLTTHKGDWK